MTVAETMTMTQYLTFRLAEEVYALPIGKVREVLDVAPATKVPRMPDFLRGVINLRGSVVPVVDLRLKLGMPATGRSIHTCVIITEVTVDGATTVLGCLADSVQEVLELDAAEIAAMPNGGSRLRTEFIAGMGRHGDRFLIIIDVDRLFSSDDQDRVQEIVAIAGADAAA